MPQVLQSPLTTGQFDEVLFQEHLRELFWNAADAVDSVIDIIFHREKTNRYQEELYSMAPMTPFVRWDEEEPITYETIESRYHSIITPVDYSKGISYSRVLKRDLAKKYRILQDTVAQFASRARITQELTAAHWLADGFTVPWNSIEGKPLFSDSHPLGSQVGGTYSNLITGGMNIANIQAAISLLEMTPDDTGVVGMYKAKRIIFHPKKRWLVDSILGSPGEYDSPNNAKNTLAGELERLPWRFLPSEDMWFIQADKSQHRLYWFDREPLQTDSELVFDTGATKHKAWYSAGIGAADWRGIVGSLG